jgi:hypothetical protein
MWFVSKHKARFKLIFFIFRVAVRKPTKNLTTLGIGPVNP